MKAVIIETVVNEEHQLHCTLPASLPTGCRLRVVIEPVEDFASDPLEWPLTEAECAIWDELPTFRTKHPLKLDSLGS